MFKVFLGKLVVSVVVGFGAIVLLAEWLHHRQHGHFFRYGPHADVLSRDTDIGIPGVTKMYWVKLANYTPLPIPLTACDFVDDAMQPGTEYPYAVQRWDSVANAWQTIVEMNGDGFCKPVPLSTIQTKLASKLLWPGMEADVMDGEATGAREPFQKGDHARFIVFTTHQKEHAWQSAITSMPFVIQDQMERNGINFRVKH